MQEKVLIIEDESSIADNISYALSTEGFSPIVSETGRDSLRILSRKDILLIILDVGLPDVNGFELLKEIRRYSNIPVIIVTARTDEVDKVVGLEIGADDYVVKPFSPRELTARVRAVLRRAAHKSSEPGRAEKDSTIPFKIDEACFRISYFNEQLDLSRYEYRLLRYFILNPGRVFTREQIMESVWEEPDMSLDRTVDTHIKTLRQKLKAVRSDVDPIVTHRGLGYSLKEDW